VPIALQSVTRDSLKIQIARQLIELIVSGRVQAGEALPAERELAQQFGVSRTAIREAVSVVAAQGFVDVRQGSGTFVTPRDSWNVTHPLVLLVTDRTATLRELIQARELLEPQVAALAAERATPEDIVSLVETVNLTGSLDQQIARDMAFHLTLAKSSHNQVLLIMLSSINDLMYEVRRETFTSEVKEQVLARHLLILDKVRQRDAQGAFDAMRQHLKEAKREYLPGVRDQGEDLEDQEMSGAATVEVEN